MNLQRHQPPYRAEHVGSLPRPPELLQASDAYAQGQLSLAALREVEDRAIRAAVAMQERIGIGAITDGEYRRRTWREYLYERVEGFGGEKLPRDFPFREADGSVIPAPPEPQIVQRLVRREPMAAAEFAALKNLTARPTKVNMPSWSWTHFYMGDRRFSRSAYPDRAALMKDVVRILREEVADLSARGCTYLQIDEVPLALMCDPKNRAVIAARGDDPEQIVDLYIALINDAISARPHNMRVAVHMCRGNWKTGMGEGSYQAIAEKLFGGLNVDGFFLEYDTPRAGDFSPLRYLSGNKVAMLGLMSSKETQLETVDELRRRIDEATRFLPLERIGIAPQCGFSSIPSMGTSFSLDLVERKLARLVETAHAVWN